MSYRNPPPWPVTGQAGPAKDSNGLGDFLIGGATIAHCVPRRASPDGDVKGPLADVGKGKLKPGDWNECVVEAIGPRVRVWVNGLQVSGTTDEKISRRGVIAFPLPAGVATDVRLKDFTLVIRVGQVSAERIVVTRRGSARAPFHPVRRRGRGRREPSRAAGRGRAGA
ncbi:MAG TPA: family 16 glycoside hydrolase [Gemmataceae bacterium]|nr:family 16 glycoside hydrolase [Gemmataceae bacterium]